MYIGNLSLEQIADSKEIKDALRRSLFQSRDNAFHYPYELEKRLYAAMLEGDFDTIREVSRECSNFPPSVLCEGNPRRSLKNMMICNCALITRVMIQAGLHENYAYFLNDLFINKIESLTEKDALLRLNTIIIIAFMSAAKSSVVSRRSISSRLVHRAVDYVEEHLYDDISLEAAAAALHTNGSYLSRLFKREVGLSFTEYAHRSRIKKAQQLLLLTDLPIATIASDLGYSSHSHFTRIFKRICGVTPQHYALRRRAERFVV